jgi:hypothetical protein
VPGSEASRKSHTSERGVSVSVAGLVDAGLARGAPLTRAFSTQFT